MFNFEEEVAKFSPSLEIEQAEEAVLENRNLDITDILDSLVPGVRKDRSK